MANSVFPFPEVPKHEYAYGRVPEASPPKVPHWTCTGPTGDPLQPREFVLFAPGAQPLELRTGDAVATFAPTDSRVADPAALGLTLEVFEALCEQHGADDTGESTPEWIEQGTKAMREVLAVYSQDQPVMLKSWRKENELGLRTAEARGRYYAMPPEAIAQITGRPYIPRRSLWPTGIRARELETQKRAREEAEAKAAALAAEALSQAQRVYTIGEKRLSAVAMRLDRLGDGGAVLPGLLGHVVRGEAWPGATSCFAWDAGVERVFAFQAPAGMAPVPFARDGIRALAPDEIIPPNALGPHGADRCAVDFLRDRRCESGLIDFGPMPADALRSEVPSVVPTLAAEWARTLLSVAPQLDWRKHWLCEVLVRCEETRLRPDVALGALLEALDAEFKRQRPDAHVPVGGVHLQHFEDGTSRPLGETRTTRTIQMYRPSELPSNAMRVLFGNLLAAAALRGSFVGVRESIDPAPVSPAKPKARKAGEGK